MSFSRLSKKKKFLIGIVLAGAVVYAMDTLSWWANIPSRPEYSTYTIRKYYYINENFGKYSVESAGTYPEKCVNALLPHVSARPCWYVSTHLRNVIHVN